MRVVMKVKVIIFFVLLFVIINGSVYFVSKINAQERIELELKDNLESLNTHYEILLHTHKSTAKALYIGTVENSKVIEILKEAQGATQERKTVLRDELQKQVNPLYERAKLKDVLQFQFVLPNNESFLRMHKPSKFGDDLTGIRADFKYTNETKKPVNVFTQGRTSHGFRNTFPIFDKNENYLGALEISFSSDSFQWYLNHISHIHTHFLVNKNIFDSKAWVRDDLIIKYFQSSENSDFMLSVLGMHSKESCIDNNRVKLAPIKEEIEFKMLQMKEFTSYVEYQNKIEVISFMPIKNLDDKAIAWLVSYEKSEFIDLTLHSLMMVRIVAFIFSILVIFLIIREMKLKKLRDYEEHIFSLVNIIEKRDSYTAGHTQRVAEYSVKVAKEMGFSQMKQDEIYKASILHDIGKISTPDSILLKPGKLNDLEYEIIKEHSEVGYGLLKNVEIYKDIAEIMRHHHERYDGKGYPQGLRGNETPLLSQIMIVTDAFDAMTTNRIYKPKKSVAEAIDELKELSSKQFNPKVVQAAVIALKDIEIEDTITQQPKTKMEKERFSYFYRDQVSGVYNKEYLELVLAYNGSRKLNVTCLNAIYLNNFSQYNKKYGWDRGDIFLKEFAQTIHHIDKEAFVFRIYGDDFIILSRKHCDIQEFVPRLEELLVDTGITAKYKHHDMDDTHIMTLAELDEHF